MVKLTISNSEWNVLYRILINGKTNSFKAQDIINHHKKILNDFKEKLEFTKAKELAKFKKQLDKNAVRDRDNRILKFEKQKDEELQEKFKNHFYKIAQDIESKF